MAGFDRWPVSVRLKEPGSHPGDGSENGTRPVAKKRLYFADHLRAALVGLVILHHTAITYGGSGSFYYTEPATDSAAAGLLTIEENQANPIV